MTKRQELKKLRHFEAIGIIAAHERRRIDALVALIAERESLPRRARSTWDGVAMGDNYMP